MSGTILDVPGIRVGHQSLGSSGVTAIVSDAPGGMVGAVDVRGGGPGTRETDLLAPHNTVERVHAVILSGGSAFGLAAADGAMRELESRGRGFAVFGEGNPGPRVPIVPAAVIFDLILGDPIRPSADDGARAVAAAFDAPDSSSGSIGAGCGATAGVLRGGFGQASSLVDEYVVAAAVVANPMGNVIDEATGEFFAAGDHGVVDKQAFRALERPMPKLNTTIGVIATNAPVPVAQLQRLAMTGHDGLARAVRPAHSPLDGDTLFAVSTAEETQVQDSMLLGRLCEAAAQCVEEAIVDAVKSAQVGYNVKTWQEIAQ
ncbi:P1 family peptidase [Corynebacterium lubricantis]|uniref:P1 family peptidase n=1 Tax=Corynebacterium lubricantis TaxID=541095 RepID=UPI000365564B|nr:P1 family peptidase [Corynebacterium lubricantis]